MARNLAGLRHSTIRAARTFWKAKAFIEVENSDPHRLQPPRATRPITWYPSRASAAGEGRPAPVTPNLFKQLLMVGGRTLLPGGALLSATKDLPPIGQPEFTQLRHRVSYSGAGGRILDLNERN